jgi:hypothetical protein
MQSLLYLNKAARSSMNVKDNIKFFFDPPSSVGYIGKGWSAKAEDRSYLVTFNFIDKSARSSDAIWSVDLGTKKVQYINKNAKFFELGTKGLKQKSCRKG